MYSKTDEKNGTNAFQGNQPQAFLIIEKIPVTMEKQKAKVRQSDDKIGWHYFVTSPAVLPTFWGKRVIFLTLSQMTSKSYYKMLCMQDQ